jgi:toxin CptA
LSSRSLRLELAPSFPLALALLAAHGAAAACLILVLPGLAGVAAAALAIGLGLRSTWTRALLRSASSIRVLQLGGSTVEMELASGEALAAEPAGRRYVGRHLVLLPLRRPVRRTVLVSRDMLDADSFRRLRIWALWGKLPPLPQAELPPVARAQLPA